MQYLKALVIGMGLLIVLGMGLLVYGFVAKGKDKAQNSETFDTMDPGKGFGEISLNLSDECYAEHIIAEGRRLIINLRTNSSDPENNCAKTIILDMATGKTLGTISHYK